MGHRYAAGGTLASFPLIAAVPAFQAGNLCLAWIFIGVFAVTLVGVAAPKLPLVHKLGWGVGAPKVEAEFELNGSPEMSVRLPKDPDRRSLSALLLVRIRPPENRDVGETWVNVVLPRGIRVDRVDAYGEQVDEGRWLQPIRHQLGDHEWADRWSYEFPLTAGLSREFWFKLEFSEGGTYPLCVKVGSSALHGGEYRDSAKINVAATGGMTLRDQISQVIDRGERFLRLDKDKFVGGEPSGEELLTWFISGHEVMPQELDDLLEEVPSDPSGSGAEPLIRSQLRGLYDAQRALP